MPKGHLKRGNTIALMLGFAFAELYLHIQFSLPGLYVIFYHLGFGGMGIAAFLFCKRKPVSIPPFVAWAASVVICLAPILVNYFGMRQDASLIVLGLLCGGGALVFFAQWFTRFCTYPANEAFDLILVSALIEPLLRIALIPLGDISSDSLFILISISSIISMAFLHGAGSVSPNDENRPQAIPESNPLGTTGVAAELIVFGIVFGIMHNVTADVAPQPFLAAHVLQFLVPLFLLAWIHLKAGRRVRSLALRTTTAAVLLLYFATVFFGDTRQSAIPVSVILVCDIASTFFILTFYQSAKTYGHNPLVVYGLGRGLFELSLLVGIASLETPFSNVIPQISDGFVYLGVIFIVLLMVNRFFAIAELGGRTMRPQDASDVNETLKRACDKIGRKRDLSERQVEIMLLTCRGYAKPAIAKELYISESTVRWHTKQLYAKLGIHSKRELLDLVETEG